ncbi:MAG: hypothetical protein LBU89_13995 [Fibromonadaceae bacterium]|jgi:hypothetical protein|nr:hypothetical protein [Fibromonadaceae bacterium]
MNSILKNFSVAITLAVLAFTQAAWGQDMSAVITAIETIDGLVAVESPTGTVTVTGDATASSTLTLNIPKGGTVLWKAKLTGSAGTLVTLTGAGAFNVEEGGEVKATEGAAIWNASTGLITISGNALVTSENTDNTLGTIFLAAGGGTSTAERLVITTSTS